MTEVLSLSPLHILFLMVLFLVIPGCAYDVKVQEVSSPPLQTEEILQKCKSARWKLYENDPELRNDLYLADITREEIECKEKEFLNILNTAIPNSKNRKQAIESFQGYKAHFLNLYGVISQKNILCDENWMA